MFSGVMNRAVVNDSVDNSMLMFSGVMNSAVVI
jgi:hypothetical protein